MLTDMQLCADAVLWIGVVLRVQCHETATDDSTEEEHNHTKSSKQRHHQTHSELKYPNTFCIILQLNYKKEKLPQIIQSETPILGD